MMIPTDVLQSLCQTSRASTAEPFSFKFDGSWWDAATNGHAIVCVRQGSGENQRDYAPPIEKKLQGQAKYRTHVAIFDALLSWLNDVPKEKPCPDCNGTGRHVCNCRYCEVLEGSVCPECEGDKCLPNRVEVTFGRWRFDRVLAARYLSIFSGHIGDVDVFFGGESDPFEFRTQNWRVLVMPMRYSEEDKSTGEVPAGLLVPA